jgi:hypothetical protein
MGLIFLKIFKKILNKAFKNELGLGSLLTDAKVS